MTAVELFSIILYFNQLYCMLGVPAVLANTLLEPKLLSAKDILNFWVIFARWGQFEKNTDC